VLRSLAVLLLVACLDPSIQPCDEYVEYLCLCDPDACDEVTATFRGASASLQETCQVQLACFEGADAATGSETCQLFLDDRVEECAPT